MILLAQSDLTKAAQDLATAKDVDTLKSAIIVLLTGLAVFFFYKWQAEVAQSRAEDKEQIDLLLKGKEAKP